jgi:putative transposase
MVEQDHRFVKKITKPMMGFKSFWSAQATLAGIELHHILRKISMEIAKQLLYLSDFMRL